jgi:hypothetical protein
MAGEVGTAMLAIDMRSTEERDLDEPRSCPDSRA